MALESSIVPVSGLPNDPLLPRIAGFGLPGFDPAPCEPVMDWNNLARRLRERRLTGIGLHAVDSGWLPADEDQRAELEARHRELMLWNLHIEQRLLAFDAAFRHAGIDYVVLKGPSLAHTVYDDPALRAFGDLDLLVRSRDWSRASSILGDFGFKRRHAEAQPGFTQSFGKAAVHTDERGLEVDLHRTLVVGPFGLSIEPEELFRRTDQFSLGDRRLPSLDDTFLFLHVCMHAALGFRIPTLVPLRDVFQVAAHADVDWDEMGRWTRRWRLQAVVKHAVELAASVLEAEAPAEATRLTAGMAPTAKERRWLAAYTTDTRERGGPARLTIAAIPGMRAKAAYVRALLFPGRAFLETRGEEPGWRSYLKRWSIPLRWLLRNTR